MENNYQLSRIHNYVNGLMSKEDMYALEKEALDDPFLQDAIEGYRLQKGVDIKQLSLLQQRLVSRVEKQAIYRNRRFYSWQRLTIGLVAAVMFVTVCSLILFRYLPSGTKANVNEVVVADAMYDYMITSVDSEADVIPDGGWQAFYQVLNTKYSNSQQFEGELLVTFDVDANNRAYSIKMVGFEVGEDEELEDLIRNNMKWIGKKASIKLRIRKIGH